MANKPDPFLDNPFQTNEHWKKDYAACKKEHEEPLRRNHIFVSSQGQSQVDDLLKMHGSTVAYMKVGSVSAKYRDDVFDVLTLGKAHGIRSYVGGGFMESAKTPKAAAKNVAMLQAHEIDTVEVSNTKDMNLSDLEKILKGCRADGMHVLLEVGRKSSRGWNLDSWRREIALQEHADRLVFEGGGSGNVGIYDNVGRPLTGAIWELMREVEHPEEVIIEAPDEYQQKHMINQFGYYQMLGNVHATTSNLMNVNETRLNAMNANARRHAKIAKTEAPMLLADIRQFAEQMQVSFDEMLLHTGGTLATAADRDEYEEGIIDFIRRF